MIKINIAEDFSETPGGRFITYGRYSGEEFRINFLEENFDNDEIIEINLDGTYGYPVSFLEEAFGGLARKYGSEYVLSKLDFISKEDPFLIDEIKEYIRL